MDNDNNNNNNNNNIIPQVRKKIKINLNLDKKKRAYPIGSYVIPRLKKKCDDTVWLVGFANHKVRIVDHIIIGGRLALEVTTSVTRHKTDIIWPSECDKVEII